MSKAKSRLKRNPITDSKYFSLAPKSNEDKSTDSNQSQTKKQMRGNRAKYYPTLVLGLFFGLIFGYIILNIPPDQIKNVLLPATYLPLLLVFFLMIGFIASFVLLNSRRGFVLSGFLSTILALKLQQVELSKEVLGLVFGIFLVILVIWEISLTLKRKK